MFNKRITQLLVKTYDNNFVRAQMEHDEALHEAINSACSPFNISDERKADLFARLQEKWDEYKPGAMRRMYVAQIVQRWNIDHIHPPIKDAE